MGTPKVRRSQLLALAHMPTGPTASSKLETWADCSSGWGPMAGAPVALDGWPERALCNVITYRLRISLLLARSRHGPPGMTPSQSRSSVDALILQALHRETGRAIGAYGLLDRLRPAGVNGLPTVYRALARLSEAGLIHRVECLNAYVVRAHRTHAGPPVVAVCDACGAVEELTSPGIGRSVAAVAARARFALETAVIEVNGRCRLCRETKEFGEAT